MYVVSLYYVHMFSHHIVSKMWYIYTMEYYSAINLTCHRGLISKVHKELKMIDFRKPNNPIKMGHNDKQKILNW
jgi:hypothetical protein